MAKQDKSANETESTSNAMVVASEARPAWLADKDTKRGSENVKAEDLVIPRLELVQDLSPCRKKADPAYIDGAEEGMLYNNVTRQLYGTSVLVVPVYFRKEWLIWKDRKQGGGFRGAFPTKEAAEDHMSTLEDAEHCEAIDTAQHFCLLIQPEKGRIEEIVISMSRSKMKVSRKWNSLIRMDGGDSFARVYRITAGPEKNSKNQDYYNINIAMAGYPTEAIYARAEALYEQIAAGKVGINRDFEEQTGPDEGPPPEY